MPEAEEEKVKSSVFVKGFIAYIYFVQGVYLGLCSSSVYLFPVFPSPDVLSYFSLAVLPFSFKYVTGTPALIQPLSSKNSQGSVTGVENFGLFSASS
jgi:hypothetical protein